MCGTLLLIACLLGPAGKPAWDIPDSDRVSLRFDASASAVRRTRAIAEGEASPAGDGNTYFVLGRHNPELLMGTELMGMLVVVYQDDTDAGRKFRDLWWQKGIDRFGGDFWTRLREVAGSFIERETETRRRLRERSKRGPVANADPAHVDDPSGTALCLLRADALAAARGRFGRERFDGFLYEVIAPQAGVVETRAPDSRSVQELMLWAEGGCR